MTTPTGRAARTRPAGRRRARRVAPALVGPALLLLAGQPVPAQGADASPAPVLALAPDRGSLAARVLVRAAAHTAPAVVPAAGSGRADRPARAGRTRRTTLATGTPGLSGRASWYGPGFHGRRTASGERFDRTALTTAHRTLPFGTRLRVCLTATGRCVVVRVNDRGPFTRGRVLDLSEGAARAIGLHGIGHVTATRLPRR